MGNRNSGRRKSDSVVCVNCGFGEKFRGSWCRDCRRRYAADYKRLKGQAEEMVDYGKNLSWKLLDDVEEMEGRIWLMAKGGEYVSLEVEEMMRRTDYYLEASRK
jgi:hypothetical protein